MSEENLNNEAYRHLVATGQLKGISVPLPIGDTHEITEESFLKALIRKQEKDKEDEIVREYVRTHPITYEKWSELLTAVTKTS